MHLFVRLVRRRKLLAASTGLAVLLLALAHPVVHWHLFGWAKGEPFFRGWPASYWRSEVASCVDNEPGCDVIYHWQLPIVGFRRPYRPGLLDFAGQRLDEILGREPRFIPVFTDPVPGVDDGPASLPVLRILLDDADPKVRYFAAQHLGRLGEAARSAVPDLVRRLGDGGLIGDHDDDYGTVGDAACAALWRIDKAAWEATGRPLPGRHCPW